MYKKDHLGQRPFKVFPKTPPSLPNWESNRPLVPLFYPEVGMSMQESRFLRILKIFFNFTSRSWFWGIFISLFTLDLDLEPFSIHFSFLISSTRYFHFTFHSRSRSWAIFNSLFILDLEHKVFSFHFSLSILILSHFHFTFRSRSRSQDIFISLFILEMSELEFHFTFHFSNFQYPLSQDTVSKEKTTCRWRPPYSGPTSTWVQWPRWS